jgi:flagellar L-ring protein precursor FlgH
MLTRTLVLLSMILLSLAAKEKREKPLSPLDRFLAEITAADTPATSTTPGALWTPGSSLVDLGSDLRPRRVGDAITIVVRDRASAVAKGTVKTARSSAANASVTALAGIPSAAGALPNLLDVQSDRSLNGEGLTSRETLLQTTLSARVTHVLPNGDMVVSGYKSVRINSEAQTVEVRGIVRPLDISPANTIISDQLSFLEVAVDGKGVVNDAIRRPNFLYRLLLGLLPF